MGAVAGQNPLVNIIRFGWTPRGNAPSSPPTGTDYRHRQWRGIVSIDKPWVDFSFQPLGNAPAAGGSTGTDYRHRIWRYVDLSKPFVEFGFMPLGSGGTTPAAKKAGWIGKRRPEPKPRDPWAQTLTPKAWDELQALLSAERATAERADATTGKRAAALNRAADAARDAIEAIERAEVEADTARITAALEAATGATRITAVLKHARAAVEYAHALRIAIEEAEEEEEAIVLLLMH